MACETVARGLRALERVGLLSRTKRRLRVAWHQGGVRVAERRRPAVESKLLGKRAG